MLYDAAVIGAGPAGLTAGIYLARYGLKTVILEKMFAGGQASTTYEIENYPGFVDGIGGPELALRMEEQARKFGAEIKYDEVKALTLKGDIKTITTAKDEEVTARGIILAMGAQPRELGLKNEGRLRGAGVSYCATCDGAFYKGKRVIVVGGGDTAVEDALFLSKLAAGVHLVHRRDELRAVKSLQQKMLSNDKVKIIWDSVVTEIIGEDRVTGVEIANKKTGRRFEMEVDGVFIAIGLVPNSSLVKGMVKMTDEGYIITDENMWVGIDGVFAAGDIRQKPLRQVVTSASDGAVAATGLQRYISKNF
ncbi:MAG TPA: thioredoxin-disulfide reductase [Clostridiales bacterium]|nr:thioredoxin-disulfide reductase [Clostridiales bacterium]